MSFHETNRKVINMSWYNPVELPFIIGHEIGHLIHGDLGDNGYGYSSVKGSQEREADNFSLKLLFNYSIKNADYFDEPYEFIEQYGISIRMLDTAVNLFQKYNDLTF